MRVFGVSVLTVSGSPGTDQVYGLSAHRALVPVGDSPFSFPSRQDYWTWGRTADRSRGDDFAGENDPEALESGLMHRTNRKGNIFLHLYS